MPQKYNPSPGSLFSGPHSFPYQDSRTDPSASLEHFTVHFFLQGVFFMPSLEFFYPFYIKSMVYTKAHLYDEGSPETQNADLIHMGLYVFKISWISLSSYI